MKISIITVVYNGEATIRDCIRSVLGQDFCNKEYIIIDGASKDGTMRVVSEFSGQVQVIRSEPDAGIYDAMNKGIALATGEVIGILNADDMYAGDQVLSKVAASLDGPGYEGCYSDLVYVDAATGQKVTRKWIAGSYRPESFLWGWMPPHPTLFLRKEVYEQYGSFRLDMGSAADYELMLRMLYKHTVKTKYIPETLVKMRAGGVSNLSLANRLKANQNDRRAWEVNGLKPLPFTLLLKPLRKIHQFF
ncbi:MAG: glycosyl transferase [Cytophagaceae bacterium SCN 52-12]|nr:MAG: glycosyl transferase [Cytophagaceae bacterium SCN 52-12]